MPDDVVIRVENLSKRYKIGARQQGYKTLRESIMGALASPFCRLVQIAKQKAPNDASHAPNALANPMPSARCPMPSSSDDTIWALKDVSFEVKRGEVVGIIGRNGAGKTTLLKILSRITEPTEGRAEIYGRVGSLLEVGTGFHPELTGRENIYLNGAILGMRKVEIERKFDEIVDFAEIEKFIDTPVKRYSSGMFVRLAFSVAAHLEPEILLVDEVLAVGDVAFQRKCIGQMSDVSKQGRTVLFVSHNMAAVEALCSRGLILNKGELMFDARARQAVNTYTRESSELTYACIRNRTDREGNGEARITDVELTAADGIACGKPLSIVIHYESTKTGVRIINAGLSIWTFQDARLISLEAKHQPGFSSMPSTGKISCRIPVLPLVPGEYFLNPSIFSNSGLADYVVHGVSFTVADSDFYGSGRLPDREWGAIVVDHSWNAGGS